MEEKKSSYYKNQERKNNTNHVEIRSLFDQAGYNVFMQEPSGHVQGRHPTTVNGINTSTMAG